MKAALESAGDTLRVSGELNFATVSDLLAEGQRWLSGQAPVHCRVDLSSVSRCNSAGIALLLGWLRAADAANKSLKLEHIPESLLSLLRLAGLEPLLSSFLPAAVS